MIKHRVLTWLPLALLVAVPVATVPRLLMGESLFWGLPALQFYPWRSFAVGELAAGRLPAWNPYLGAGAPLLANYQSAVLYPPNWLLLVLPDAQAMSWAALVHVAWAGVGMWLFGRALGLAPFGRGISALSYALSGYLIGRLGSLPTLDAAAWLPWIIWLVHRIAHQRRLRDTGWLALAFGVQLLAGHAQTTLYSALAAGAFAGWLALWRLRALTLGQRVRGLVLTGAGFALGTTVAVAQLLPTAEYWLESQRSSGVDFARLTNLSYHPMRLITLLSPNFYGTPADGSYATEGIYFEDAAYIGFVPVLGALAALVAWWRTRHSVGQPTALASAPFWAGLSLAGLLLALGGHTPLYKVLYSTVPTFDAFREPVRWLLLSVFGSAILAGIGVEHAWSRGPRTVFWSRLAAAGGAGVAVMALAGLAGGTLGDSSLRAITWGLVVLGCWIAGAALLTLTQPVSYKVTTAPVAQVLWRVAVLLFVAFDLGWMANGLNPTVPSEFFEPVETAPPSGRIYWFEPTRYRVTFGDDDSDSPTSAGYFDVGDYRIARERWREVRLSRLPNIPMLDGIHLFNNNDPLLPRYHADYVELIEAKRAEAGALLRAAAITEVYGPAPTGWQGASPATAPYADEVEFAWLVPHAMYAGSDEAARAALADREWDPQRIAVLSGEPPPTAPVALEASGIVEELPGTPTERRFRVQASAPAILIVSQTWYPGWTATIDGTVARLWRANLTFQAVAVPPGVSDVVLNYHVRHWESGVAVSALGLLVICLLLAAEDMLRIARGR